MIGSRPTLVEGANRSQDEGTSGLGDAGTAGLQLGAAMRASGARRHSPLAALRRPFAAWFAVLAVIIQLGVAALHPAMAAAQRDLAAAALSAAIGQDVSLCDHPGDDSGGAPAGNGHSCDDDCPLCRIASHAAAILPKPAVSPLVLGAPASTVLIPGRSERALAPVAHSTARPRAPPIPV